MVVYVDIVSEPVASIHLQNGRYVFSDTGKHLPQCVPVIRKSITSIM